MAKVSQLKALLLGTGLQRTNIALFNVINRLIDSITSVDQTLTRISSTTSVGVGEWSVLTDGDPTAPVLIFADGDVIMTHILG